MHGCVHARTNSLISQTGKLYSTTFIPPLLVYCSYFNESDSDGEGGVAEDEQRKKIARMYHSEEGGGQGGGGEEEEEEDPLDAFMASVEVCVSCMCGVCVVCVCARACVLC